VSRQASNARWRTKQLGGNWQFLFFRVLIRTFGRRLAYFCMYVVCAWYVILYPSVRRRCRHFLVRRFPQRQSLWLRWWDSYHRIVALGEMLIDRTAFQALGPQEFTVKFERSEELLRILAEGNGLIFVNSHVGCWQMSMSCLSLLNTPVSAVMVADQNPGNPAGAAGSAADPSFKVIDPTGAMGGVMEMIQALKGNEALGLMGDRVFGSSENTVEVDFLGGRTHFPVSPYRLGSMQGTPVTVLFAHKTGFSGYEVEIAGVIRVPCGLGRKSQPYEPYAREFAVMLEAFAEKYPWQFFNFHDMWELDSNPEAGKKKHGHKEQA